MRPHEKVKQARAKLGLSDSAVARRTGLSDHEYGDIEQHPDEIYSSVELGQLRRLCAALQLNVLELLDLPRGEDPTLAEANRSEIVRQRLTELGMSPAELADRIGYEHDVGSALATNSDYFETLTVNAISEIAKVLQVPITQLLGR